MYTSFNFFVIFTIVIFKGEKTIIGDVDTDAVIGIASVVTPVPGGVGPMTVASLLTNVIDATKLQNGMHKVVWDIPAYS